MSAVEVTAARVLIPGDYSLPMKVHVFVEARRQFLALVDEFKPRFEQLLKISGFKYDDYELTNVTETTFTLHTEYYEHGDTDRDDRIFPLRWLDERIPLTAIEAAIDADRRAEQARMEQLAIERKAVQQAEQDAKDRVIYDRLRAKFAPGDGQ